MKKILLYISSILSFVSTVWGVSMAHAASAQGLLLVEWWENSANASTGITLKEWFLQTIQVYLLSAYVIVAIGSLIYIGFKLFTASWDEGEFKKAWIALVYVVVWLAIAPLAYVVVRIVSGLSFS